MGQHFHAVMRQIPALHTLSHSPVEHGFTDVSHTLEIFGTCPAC